MFFCFQLMFKLFSLRIYSQPCQFSRTSFLRLCWLDACSPGTDKGANSGKEYSSVCVCVFEWPRGFVCVCAAAALERERERAGGQTVCFHTRLVNSFTHHCGEHTHTHTLIRIWALSAASATVHQSSMGIKGELHRAERLLFVTCKLQFILRFNEATLDGGNLMESCVCCLISRLYERKSC